MNLEMRTTLLNTFPPRWIATILKALRKQLKENDKFEEIAGPVPEILLEYDQFLTQGRTFWDDVNGGICPKILCWLRDVKRLIACMKLPNEIVPMQDCKDVGKKLLDLICV